MSLLFNMLQCSCLENSPTHTHTKKIPSSNHIFIVSKIYNKSSKIPVSLRKQCKNKNNCDNLLGSKDHTLLSGNSNLPDVEFQRMVLNNYFKVKWSGLNPICQDIQETGIKTIPMEKKCKKAKWLSEETLQIAMKWKEAKSKGEKERYSHLSAKFQRIARKDKKPSSAINAKK